MILRSFTIYLYIITDIDSFTDATNKISTGDEKGRVCDVTCVRACMCESVCMCTEISLLMIKYETHGRYTFTKYLELRFVFTIRTNQLSS